MVDYNSFAKTFATSRKAMKWEELEYFFSCFSGKESIVDIGCGSGRFLEQYHNYFGRFPCKYLGIDLSAGLLEEAKKSFPKHSFQQGNMLEIKNIFSPEEYNSFLMIASFHHLDTPQKRKDFLASAYNLLPKGGRIYMTNWNLLSEENIKKYGNSQVSESKNEFGSCDFSIKIGKHARFYHSFSLGELEYLAQKAGFIVRENRFFSGERNSITILEK